MDTPSSDYQRGEDYHAYLNTYYLNGWTVIPLERAGKRPLIPWQVYQTRRPTPAEIREWCTAYPRANWGIVTGSQSRLTVLDCDSEDAIRLAVSLGLPPTPQVKTAKGAHFYFQYHPGTRNFSKRDDLPGIDLRSEGGYVVAPPSIHPTGVEYEWVQSDEALAPLPAWVVADPRHALQKEPVDALYCPLTQGRRNDALARLAGSWVKAGLPHALQIGALWNAAYCQPPLPLHEVKQTVLSIWRTDQRQSAQATTTAPPFEGVCRLV